MNGENVDSLPSGAQCGANWSEIRALLAPGEDLPKDIRGQLVALGDKCQVVPVELSYARP